MLVPVECNEENADEVCEDNEFCVDGYCCDQLCEGECEACNIAGSLGICSPKGYQEICGDQTTGDCDAADYCDGMGTCLQNYTLETVVCREATELCDADEYCTGDTQDCPEDLILAEGEICRPAVDDCDLAESCDGLTATGCPTEDIKADDGTDCGDDTETDCTLPDTCDGDGACMNNHLPAETVCNKTFFHLADNQYYFGLLFK